MTEPGETTHFGFKDVALEEKQTLLREVSGETLVLALKGADDALKEKFFKLLSLVFYLGSASQKFRTSKNKAFCPSLKA